MHDRKKIGYVYSNNRCNNVSKIQKGSGIIDFVKDPFKWLTKRTLDARPRILNELLKKEGTQIITNIQICRVPVQSIFIKLINLFTFGMFNKALQKMNYDTLFHLYMVVTLANGRIYSIEKNQRVNVIIGKKDGDCKGINYGVKTLNNFILDAEDLKISGFYRYDAFKDNCQKWIFDIMNSNKLAMFNDFILQDVGSLAPELFKKFSKKITDVAGITDFVLRGGEI
jgi:hypothetical protein